MKIYRITAQKSVDDDPIIIKDFNDKELADQLVAELYNEGEYDIISVSKSEWSYPYAEKATLVHELNVKTFYCGKAANALYGNGVLGFDVQAFKKIEGFKEAVHGVESILQDMYNKEEKK